MKWLRDNWLAVVIALGIVLSLFIIQSSTNHAAKETANEAAQAAHNQRRASIAGCVRTSVFKTLDSSFALQAAETRRADGNQAAGDYYEAIGDGIILTIPAPPGLEGSRRVAEVELKVIKGVDRYVLTPRAAFLQSEGCRLAYTPVP